ncbi:MAG: bifunctional folylpolyglutamate synthase/dihydrofolate synthase [Planctomycetota bacterium]|jgi:dihydrofolate synthase/folylpolyglutamate synthase
MNTFEEVEAWLATTTDYERMAKPPTAPGALSLDRMRRLCAACGDPQDAFTSLHVAGSKGKGTVVAYAAAWASAPGRTIGIYTSPHLVSLRERIVINGRAITTQAFVAAANVVGPACDDVAAETNDPPTFFEIITAIAFVAFRDAGVDVAVIEVGLGGRLDATNVITPAACAVTTIDLDHTAILGETKALIAREKAGIFKSGVPVIYDRALDDLDGVTAALDAVAAELGCPFIRASTLSAAPSQGLKGGGREVCVAVEGREFGPLELPATDSPQGRAVRLKSLAMAAGLCHPLEAAGHPIAPEHVRAAVGAVRLPGRNDSHPRRGKQPGLLLDGAHTPASFEVFRAMLAVQPEPRVVVLAAMADKDIAAGLALLEGLTDRLIVTTMNLPRSANPREVATAAKGRAFGHIDVIWDPAEALRFARSVLQGAGTLGVTGSLYLAGVAYEVLLGMGGDDLPVIGPPPPEGDGP